jgi:hypothetical protein
MVKPLFVLEVAFTRHHPIMLQELLTACKIPQFPHQDIAAREVGNYQRFLITDFSTLQCGEAGQLTGLIAIC